GGDVAGGALIETPGIHPSALGDDRFAQLSFLRGHIGTFLQHGLSGGSPARKRRTSSAACSAAMVTVRTEAPAMGGVSVTLGSCNSGQSSGTGSTAKVSSIAPPS